MKYLKLGIIISLSFSLIPSAKADSENGSVWTSSIPANGKVAYLDLNGDGRKERVSLLVTGQAKNRRTSTYRLKVNNVVLNDIWTESDMGGNVKVTGLLICDLNRKDRSKEIVVAGPYGLEWSAYKIYAWRGGNIQTVLKKPMMVGRFNGDGTITQIRGYGWAGAEFLYRLNRQGQFQLVRRKFNPLTLLGSNSEKNKPTRVLKTVKFYSRRDSKGTFFSVPPKSTVVFECIDNNDWVGASDKGRFGWIQRRQVEEIGVFELGYAG